MRGNMRQRSNIGERGVESFFFFGPVELGVGSKGVYFLFGKCKVVNFVQLQFPLPIIVIMRHLVCGKKK